MMATTEQLKYFYECGICDQLHPCQFAGDCRDDSNRFTIDEIEIEYGFENVVTVSMEEADDWPAPTERYDEDND